MTISPNIRVLFFDVFGTCVAQLPPLADELSRAARNALQLDTLSINDTVRTNATRMSYEPWLEFAGEWNKDIDEFTTDCKTKSGNVDWKAVDKYRLESLCKLLVRGGLVIPHEDASTTDVRVRKGSLWNEAQLKSLALVWHRLPPWPDTCRGLELLNTKFTTVTLSNTYKDLMESLVAHSGIPFQQIFTADMFQSYKPNPKVYLGAAEKIGVKPEECALVAAHLGDLKGAKACGFYAIYVERSLEEKNPELRHDNIPDLVIEEGTGGFVTLAGRLGITE